MARPWPEIDEDSRWMIPELEESLANTTRSADDLVAEASELRQRAAERGKYMGQDMLLALAERLEEAAATRVGIR